MIVSSPPTIPLPETLLVGVGDACVGVAAVLQLGIDSVVTGDGASPG